MLTTQTEVKKQSKPRKQKTNWQKIGAPYVEVDRLELTDKRLSPEEVVIKTREDILKQESAKRIHGQDDLEKVERSLGPRLNYTEILRKLWEINPDIRVKEGQEGSLALYVEKRRDEYHPSDFDEIPPNGAFHIHHKYVMGLRKEELPEWGHVTIDTSMVAHHEVRGWRSVLIGLIKARVISYRAAIKEFGDPYFDQRSQYWYEQLQKFI